MFRDKVNDAEMEGNLLHQYDTIIDFFTRNLHNVQVGEEFNSMGKLEIHSPGALPNGLTIDDIKAGTSMPRNMFLFNNAIYLLPYTDVGSGITRALGE